MLYCTYKALEANPRSQKWFISKNNKIMFLVVLHLQVVVKTNLIIDFIKQVQVLAF